MEQAIAAARSIAISRFMVLHLLFCFSVFIFIITTYLFYGMI